MKKRYLIFLFAALLLLLCGCESKKEVKTGYQIYYLNADKTKLNPMEYHPKHKDAEEMVKEFLRELSSVPEDVEYQKPIPNDVEITKYRIEGDQLSIWLDSDYYNMDAATEVFCRAAVVRTMTQIPDISCVSFFVGDSPLVDSKNNVVGLMTAESFVENPGEQINNIQEANLTLYFASATGDGLVRETQHVYYSGNTSIEKLIMERLLDGPKSSNARSAIPDTTQLVSVSVMNGACLVNLDDGFLTQNFEIKEDVIIYSIVDSLTELDTINTVQIAVNGKTHITYRDKMSLGEYYKKNLDLVIEDGDDVEVVQKQEKEGLLDTGE